MAEEIIKKRIYELPAKITAFTGWYFATDKLGEIKANGVTFEKLNENLVHNNFAGKNDGDYKHLTDAEYNNLGTKESRYSSEIDYSTLNVVSTNILRLDLNRGAEMKLSGSGIITKIILDIYDIVTNINEMIVNFSIAGVNLLAADYTITEKNQAVTVAFNTLQNTTFTDLQEFAVEVVSGGGDNAISNAKVYVYTS